LWKKNYSGGIKLSLKSERVTLQRVRKELLEVVAREEEQSTKG
jgi:hypothetical protein